MNILVTGARGKVGRAVVIAAQRAGHHVTATDQAPPAYGPTDPSAAPYVRADLTDHGRTVDLIGRVRPDAVVHTAGIPEPFQDPEVAVFDTNVPASVPRRRGRAALRRVTARVDVERDRPPAT